MSRRRPIGPANQVADDHQPGGNANARLKLDGFDIKATDGADQSQPGPDCPLGVILMGARVAEIDQDAVAHVLRDKPVQASDDIRDRMVISGDRLAQILGIERRG